MKCIEHDFLLVNGMMQAHSLKSLRADSIVCLLLEESQLLEFHQDAEHLTRGGIPVSNGLSGLFRTHYT